MRLGCGCALVSLVAVGALAGAVWWAVMMLQTPDLPALSQAVPPARTLPRGSPPTTGSGRGGTFTMSEADVTAVVARHLASADVPITEARVWVPDAGVVDIAGRVSLGDLVRESPLSAVTAVLPESWLAHRAWIVVRAIPRVERLREGGRRTYLRLDITRFAIGRARLPATMFRVVFDPATVGMLRWRLPDGVEEISPERGRVTVRIAA